MLILLEGRAMDDAISTVRHTLVLRRLEPARNVARFYALMIERDLFGRTVLVRYWGRVGGRGRERSDPHEDEVAAAEAMAKLAGAKRRRGYQDL
jgi:predicted DNA-binding WGR domain protein